MRRKKHGEHVNLERWLVSYADFITLLFAFFVVMYALSMQDLSKVKAAAESIRKAFGETSGKSTGGATVSPFDAQQATGGRMLDMPAGKTNTAKEGEASLQKIKELLEESISLELGVTDVSEMMQSVFDSRGLVVRLAAKDFFAPGEAQVRQDFRPVLDRIGRVITHTKRLVRVEGHTDPTEAQTRGYASDWELSAARAAWVVTYWIARFGLPPSQMGVAGYGHYRPLSKSGGDKSNPAVVANDWAQSKNRRIEIIFLNDSFVGVEPK